MHREAVVALGHESAAAGECSGGLDGAVACGVDGPCAVAQVARLDAEVGTRVQLACVVAEIAALDAQLVLRCGDGACVVVERACAGAVVLACSNVGCAVGVDADLALARYLAALVVQSTTAGHDLHRPQALDLPRCVRYRVAADAQIRLRLN